MTDTEAMDAFELLCETEGIIPAIERPTPWPARCASPELAEELGREPVIVVNLSGRGDKDMHTAAAYFGVDLSTMGRARGRAVSRLQDALTSAAGGGPRRLIGYLPAGYPSSTARSTPCAP